MGKSIENLRTVTRVGVDLAKNILQVHAVDAKGEVVAARALRRSAVLGFFGKLPPCVVAMEACPSLGPRFDRTRARGEADPSRACEALRSAQQERRG